MSDPINELTPGSPLSEEQRKALGESNAKESAEANRMAAEQLERDRAEGKEVPIVAAIADSLKAKLQQGDIHPPEDGTRTHTIV